MTEEGAISRRHADPLVALVPLAILITGLTFVVVSIIDHRAGEHEARDDAAQRRLDVLVSDIDSRVDVYEEALIGLRGLFQASDTVTRDEFRAFVDVGALADRFPGIQALGWVPSVATDALPDFEASIRADGLPGFTVRPPSSADDAFVATFIEPLAGNESVFGFDLGSDPARRTAIELARDTARAVATEPVTLVNETGEQAGVLLALPVYGPDPGATVATRRDAFFGVVVAVFRVGDLLAQVQSEPTTRYRVADLGAVDGPTAAEPRPIFSSLAADESLDDRATEIDVAGRRWEVRPAQSDGIGWASGALIGTLGLLATLLAAGGALLLLRIGRLTEARAVALTADLRDANEAISRSNADLEQFAYVASHDLQTPARNVQNLTELLREELGDAPPGESGEFLDLLDLSVARMRALVDGLLQFSRVQTIEADRPEQAVDVEHLLLDVHGEIAGAFPEAAAHISWGPMPTVQADPALLGLVFENLITNAVKYRHPDRPPAIEIAADRAGNAWRFTVTDNGVGIDERFHDRVFEMFSRVHADDRATGAGIGLALCKRIVERRRGQISVTSSPGVGSAFRFTVPD